ncbi:MAG TPA: hypothetical protein VHR45_02205 [Thermoanaerobaculia bacterium]|nr:hypothetical protein [Thermoanaerobaculia bacterium]
MIGAAASRRRWVRLGEIRRQARDALALLLERRLMMAAAADALILFQAAIRALAGGGEADSLFNWGVLLPLVVLGTPVMAEVVALERRAGTLALALGTPSPARFFLRRLSVPALLLTVQGAALMALAWLSSPAPFPLLTTLVQIVLIGALLATVVLFWAVTLRGEAGAVIFTSLATVALLGRWFFASPIPERFKAASGWLLPAPPELLAWAANAAVLAAATLLFGAYSFRRLARPENLL